MPTVVTHLVHAQLGGTQRVPKDFACRVAKHHAMQINSVLGSIMTVFNICATFGATPPAALRKTLIETVILKLPTLSKAIRFVATDATPKLEWTADTHLVHAQSGGPQKARKKFACRGAKQHVMHIRSVLGSIMTVFNICATFGATPLAASRSTLIEIVTLKRH